MATYLVSVTSGHIDTAKAMRNCQPRAAYCPIAVALREVFGGEWWVTSGEIIRVSPAVRSFEFAQARAGLPSDAAGFVAEFDGGLDVKPFSFRFELE